MSESASAVIANKDTGSWDFQIDVSDTGIISGTGTPWEETWTSSNTIEWNTGLAWDDPARIPTQIAPVIFPYSTSGEPPVKEPPRCEYCGRKQAKEGEPLCPGCGNVV